MFDWLKSHVCVQRSVSRSEPEDPNPSKTEQETVTSRAGRGRPPLGPPHPPQAPRGAPRPLPRIPMAATHAPRSHTGQGYERVTLLIQVKSADGVELPM